jgi:hypothetical protein
MTLDFGMDSIGNLLEKFIYRILLQRIKVEYGLILLRKDTSLLQILFKICLRLLISYSKKYKN